MLQNYKTNMWSSQKQAPDAIQIPSTIPSSLPSLTWLPVDA